MAVTVPLPSSVVYTKLIVDTEPEYREPGSVAVEVYDGKRKPKFILFLNPAEKTALRKALEDE